MKAFLSWFLWACIAVAAFQCLHGCGHAPEVVPPPTSLACQLTKEPPVWYEVQSSPLPNCLVVAGIEVPMGPCCPPETVCLTTLGGQALLVNKPAMEAWTTEAWFRCRDKR